jgi:hypothetical protein
MLIVQRRRLLLYPSYVQDYLDRVTAADVTAGNTQGLELGVTDAFNTTLQDLVGDSVLGVSGGVITQPASTIKAMPFMVGARTLQGCLVPVVGTAPTNFGFVAEDYNRKTGLVGNGSTKYLNSNRNNNADPQDSQHMGVFPTTVNSVDQDRVYMGAGLNDTGSTYFFTRTADAAVRNRSATANIGLTRGVANSLIGMNRSLSTEFVYRQSGASQTISRNSETPLNGNIFVFRGAGFTPGALSNARLAFYSIGESLDLALLDARVTALINAIAAAIP